VSKEMPLQCRECKARISWTAGPRCPFCGADNPLGYSSGTKWSWIAVAIILLFGFVAWFVKALEGLARIDEPPQR